MFGADDFEDFIVCVEALLLGADRVKKLIDQESCTQIVQAWRTSLSEDDGAESAALNKEVQNNAQGKGSQIGILKFIQISFQHERDEKRRINIPSMQIGILVDSDQDHSIVVHSDSVSRKDIEEHFGSLNVILDMKEEFEVLPVAESFVRALRAFRPQPVYSVDEVILTYPDGLGCAPLPLHNITRETVAKLVVSNFVLPCNLNYNSNASLNDDKEKIKSLLRHVRSRRIKKEDPSKFSATRALNEATASNPLEKTSHPKESPPKKVAIKSKQKRGLAKQNRRGAAQKFF